MHKPLGSVVADMVDPKLEAISMACTMFCGVMCGEFLEVPSLWWFCVVECESFMCPDSDWWIYLP